MTQSITATAPRRARALRAYRAQPWIGSALRLVTLLAATALLGGIVITGLFIGILGLLSTAGH